MISAFGPHAGRYAPGLGDVSAVVVDPDFLAEGYLEAVRRRERGERFYGMLLYDDPRAKFATAIAPQLLSLDPDHDRRLVAFRRLALNTLIVDGKRCGELWSIVPEIIQRLAPEFFALSDAVLVRSYAEHERIGRLGVPARPIERVLVEPVLPDVAPAPSRPGVVVWAPHQDVGTVALVAFGLAEFLGPVTVVWDVGGLPAFPNARFINSADPHLAEILAGAGVVVCADPSDPGPAVAFARRGYGVAAAVTTGAAEFVAGIASFDLGSNASILEAVPVAFGRPAGRPHPVSAPPPVPQLPGYPVPEDELPLVSIIVSTYNRRDDLAAVLEILSRQTYPNYEVVVVNDAGIAIDDIVAAHASFARLINRETNGGITVVAMTGLAAARGTYIQFLADDDELYPDHVQRLLSAMLRHNAAAAHANTLIRYQERDDRGNWTTIGFNASVFRSTTSPTEALISTPIAGQAMIVRTDVFEEMGSYRQDTILTDQEFQFRLWNHYPVVWVDNVTSEWRVRPKTNFSSTVNPADELERVFAEFLPLEGRPLVDERRRGAVENVRSRPPGVTFLPTFTFRGFVG